MKVNMLSKEEFDLRAKLVKQFAETGRYNDEDLQKLKELKGGKNEQRKIQADNC